MLVRVGSGGFFIRNLPIGICAKPMGDPRHQIALIYTPRRPAETQSSPSPNICSNPVLLSASPKKTPGVSPKRHPINVSHAE